MKIKINAFLSLKKQIVWPLLLLCFFAKSAHSQLLYDAPTQQLVLQAIDHIYAYEFGEVEPLAVLAMATTTAQTAEKTVKKEAMAKAGHEVHHAKLSMHHDKAKEHAEAAGKHQAEAKMSHQDLKKAIPAKHEAAAKVHHEAIMKHHAHP